jgi:isoleucyl-tRNA synthetase
VEIFYKEKELPSNMFSGNEVPGIKIAVEKAPGEKCERCWCYSEYVGKDKDYPTICEKCAEVIHNHFKS